jgi:glycosyltransferase involved in cell wall biosynthesis
MPLRILITGTTGESMPPPYAGIPKLSLLNARVWKKLGHRVAITFAYCPVEPDDFGVGAEYFFEYNGKPNKFKKILFLLRYFLTNPFLYFNLLKNYLKADPHFFLEAILYPAYGIFLDKVFFSFKPDIVLAETALIKTFMAAQIAKRRKVPIAFDTYAEIHDLSMGMNKHLNEKERKKYWESFLNLADLVIGDGNCARGALTYLPPEKVKVFYDSCDYNFYKMEISESRQTLRKYFKLPEKSFLVGAVGAFEPRKGHDYLIKAVAKLSRAGYNIGAVICGGAGDPEKWRVLAKEEGVEDKVHLFSNIKETSVDLVKLYKCLDLYCNLSNTPRSCSWDMALLEAMAAGSPIIVCNHGDLPGAVPEGQNGIVVPTNDIEAISRAILKIYQLSPEKRREMGKESSVFAAKTDINLTAGIKLNWFKEIINNFNKKI